MFTRVLVANRGEIAVRVIRALHELGIEAVAVYSTAEREAMHVQMADRAVCIGPPSATERTGDKARAKAEMRAAGVPLVPGTEGVASLAEIRVAAAELGFPVLLKATAGGGGKGMRVVNAPEELEAAYGAASAEAE